MSNDKFIDKENKIGIKFTQHIFYVVLYVLFNSLFFSLNAQTFNFSDTKFKIGDKLAYHQLFNPNCHIDVEYIPFIDSLANFLIKNEKTKILIEFHSDIRGNAEMNKKMTEICGKNRLETYLIEKYSQINRSRIKYDCVGEDRPIYTQNDIDKIDDMNKKEKAYARNRRTVIIITQID